MSLGEEMGATGSFRFIIIDLILILTMTVICYKVAYDVV